MRATSDRPGREQATRASIACSVATDADAAEIAALRTRAAEQLTRDYGRGHWSSTPSEASVLRGLRASQVLVLRTGGRLRATLRLATKKPWAINPACFTAVRRPLYLLDMAVDPDLQRQGLGRRLMEHARDVARAWPADAIRLDAYNALAGAGPFYARCGLRETGRVTYRSVPLIYFEWLLADSDV